MNDMNAPRLQRILLAEDDPAIREVTETALHEIGGYRIETCGTGDEVLPLARRVSPDLLLLDVMMPGMDGVAVFEQLRDDEDFAGTPIVFLTAKAQPAEVRRYRELGAADVIVKPFDTLDLPNRIETIWHDFHAD
jgi:CheY-like chemotaxis protein